MAQEDNSERYANYKSSGDEIWHKQMIEYSSNLSNLKTKLHKNKTNKFNKLHDTLRLPYLVFVNCIIAAPLCAS